VGAPGLQLELPVTSCQISELVSGDWELPLSLPPHVVGYEWEG